MKTKKELLCENKHDFDSLISVMAALRSEGGCPWDIEQTHESVRKCLIEETYEVVESIDKNDPVLMREELGDLVFQAVFHARIEEELGNFNMDDVIHDITHKMITRHPHVFADTEVANSAEVLVNWDNIKKEEKQITSPAESLKRVPPYLPSLIRAQKIQGKALTKFNYGDAEPDKALKAMASRIADSDNLSEEDYSNILFALTASAEGKGYDLEALLSHKTDAFISEFERDSAKS